MAVSRLSKAERPRLSAQIDMRAESSVRKNGLNGQKKRIGRTTLRFCARSFYNDKGENDGDPNICLRPVSKAAGRGAGLPLKKITCPRNRRRRGRIHIFSFQEHCKTSFRKKPIISADASCLQRSRPSAKTETLSYFTVPLVNLYIGPPSVQASFLKSDLYIQYLPLLPGAKRLPLLKIVRHSFPTAVV